MLCQDLRGEICPFALPDSFKSGPFSREIKATYPTEQAQMGKRSGCVYLVWSVFFLLPKSLSALVLLALTQPGIQELEYGVFDLRGGIGLGEILFELFPGQRNVAAQIGLFLL